MIAAQLAIRAARASRKVELADYLSAAAEEQAHVDEYRWIKALRHAQVDGDAFRDRFIVRGDSLWWFTELYLHKDQVVLDIHRAAAAVRALIDREQPHAIDVISAGPIVRHVVREIAASRGVAASPGPTRLTWTMRLARLHARARLLAWRAHLAPDRFRGAPPVRSPAIAAFVHRAFWRRGGDDGGAEAYIGPVLQELERRLEPGAIQYVGVGPATNFRAKRTLTPGDSPAVVIPVERFAPPQRLAASRAMWKRRSIHHAAMLRSRALRQAADIAGIDCWPLVKEQLAGVAWLQWPWSVRAMDEAAAALDALAPASVVTYAEAGGWGRALVLEARRRGIPSAGLQHGFIYRHWLNYRHEPDEVVSGKTPGFPAPTRTLLFDASARDHLQEHGRFSEGSLVVTGSPRLDDLVRAISALSPEAIADARRAAAVADDEMLVLLTTKEREVRRALPSLVRAAAGLAKAKLVVKPHPAETADVYASAVAGQPHVRMLSPSAPLAPLLAAARAVVTVNSTVALDAAALDVPALAIGLPNNLSPFVEAGAIAGADDPAELPALLQRILYDERFRQQLAERRSVVLGPMASLTDGRSAARSAEALLQLAGRHMSEG